MVRKWIVVPLVLVLGALPALWAGERAAALSELSADFERYSGAKLVFAVADLPPGKYHDKMAELSNRRKLSAARIADREVRKLPRGYLGAIGLKAVGVFANCVSFQGDGFRPFNDDLGGYRYYGIYNGADAVAGAYYTDEQLPLTFHHEIFHHVDHVAQNMTATTEGDRLAAALDGTQPYPPPFISPADLELLRERCGGDLLETTVSEYAAKNAAEDKAETARHLMSTLADSLVQVVDRPQLPGSQRLLHVLDSYAKALPEGGPRVEWFVNVALGRGEPGDTAENDGGDNDASEMVKRLIDVLQSFANRQAGQQGPSAEAIRHTLAEARRAAAEGIRGEPAAALARAAAAATERLLTDRICPSGDAKRFVVRGREDAAGVNWALRRDLEEFGRDAVRLREIAAREPDLLSRTLVRNVRWIARWYVYIASRWEVTPGTTQLFEQLRATLAASLPDEQSNLAAAVVAADFGELAETLNAGGTWPASAGPLESVNRYLKNVDDEIPEVAVRRAIRRVQPACVRLGAGSGVNVAPQGPVLTAAHVARQLGTRLTAEFPNGRRYTAECIALDKRLDVALCRLVGAPPLPFAKLAVAPPTVGTRVVCIGQPGTRTPAGKPTDYQPFHVSTGEIRGFLDDRLGDQTLGRTKHDAWTYWGHSGSPLFNEQGEIVAMHNSWDNRTAMRHAVTHEALAEFLRRHRAALATD
jgi:hypothetical protein